MTRVARTLNPMRPLVLACFGACVGADAQIVAPPPVSLAPHASSSQTASDEPDGARPGLTLDKRLHFTPPPAPLVIQHDDPLPTLIAETQSGSIRLSTSLRLEYARTTYSADAMRPHERVGVRTAQGRETASADIYDASLRWDMRRAAFTLTPHAGVRAVRYESFADRAADIDADDARTTGMGAAPAAGLVLRWDASERVYFESGGAVTFMRDHDDPDFFDFNASTGFRLQHNVGLLMGYQRLRTTAQDQRDNSFRAESNVVYARIELRF